MTSPKADIGGEITIRLQVVTGKVSSVDIASSRLPDMSRMFLGRTPEQVLPLIGTVFSLCGKAQTIAGLQATESALGLRVSRAQHAARDMLRLAEMLTQTAWRLCLNWPQALNLPPDPALPRLALAAEGQFEQALFGGAGWKSVGGAALELDAKGIAKVIETLQSGIRSLTAHGGLAAQLRDGIAAAGLDGFGALPMNATPEAGALSRQWHNPEVNSLRKNGAGLAARLAASLADLNEIASALSLASATLASDHPKTLPHVIFGSGDATVMTARGPLKHAVTLRDGVYAAYEINAPTEGNFAPNGPVVAGLIGADATDAAALTKAAMLHILAIDPCIRYSVEVDHA